MRKIITKKGLIKIQNFKKSKKKLNYLYILTPQGISRKSKLAISFIKNKMSEYDKLIKEESNVLENNSKLKEQIKEFGIGHNSSILNPQIEENKTRTKPLFKTIQVNIKKEEQSL